MVDAKVFAQAVDRVATISAEKSRSVRMAIESGRVVLTVRNMEAGQAVEELEIDYDGEPFELSFNARYLMDITDQISGGAHGAPLRRPQRPGPGARSGRRGRPVHPDAAAGVGSASSLPFMGRVDAAVRRGEEVDDQALSLVTRLPTPPPALRSIHPPPEGGRSSVPVRAFVDARRQVFVLGALGPGGQHEAAVAVGAFDEAWPRPSPARRADGPGRRRRRRRRCGRCAPR